MSVTELVPWFQIASTVISGLGIIVSVSLGIASLNNNRRERLAKVRPDLLFNIGGQEIAASLSRITFIPGYTQTDLEIVSFLQSLPKEQKGPSLNSRYGQLFNHGAGPALSVYIWFKPDRLVASGNERRLSRAERYSPPYTRGWNWIAAMPANISEGEAAYFGILPVSVYAASPSVTEISGMMHIECRDKNEHSHQWRQPTTFFIDRAEDTALITVSFGQRPLQ